MNHKKPLNVFPKELKQWLEEDSSKPILIDVREKEELAIASLNQNVLHLPLSDYSNWIDSYYKYLSFEERLVVICHSGIRSRNFAIWLIDQGWNYKVCNLEGGIDAWSIRVDSSVPRY